MKTKTIEEIEMSKRIGKVYNYSVNLCEKISENDQFARVVTSRYLTNIQMVTKLNMMKLLKEC